MEFQLTLMVLSELATQHSCFNLMQFCFLAATPAGKMIKPYAFLFRTHIWNEFVERSLDRLVDRTPGAEVFVIADETAGQLDTGKVPKIGHAVQEFIDLGLPDYPRGKTMWYNGDYPLYAALRALPDFDYFVMCEFDVVLNTDITRIIESARTNKLDLIAHRIEVASQGWPWHKTAQSAYATVHRCLIPLVIVSKRALVHLLDARLRLAESYRANKLEDWPHCEAFLASELLSHGAFKVRLIGDYGNTSAYNWWPPIEERRLSETSTSAFVHPVLCGEDYLASRLRFENNLHTFFEEGSPLQSDLEQFPLKLVVAHLRHEFQKRGDGRSTEMLHAYLSKQAREDLSFPLNYALGRPASQSSASRWSSNADPRVDARGGNNGKTDGLYGFHTDLEENPWWRVDLETVRNITKVVIYNRVDQARRASNIRVRASLDSTSWLDLYERNGAGSWGDDGSPLIIDVGQDTFARYLQVELVGRGFLHLREIEVY